MNEIEDDSADEAETPLEIDFMGVKLTSEDAANFMNEVAEGDQSCPVCKQVNWAMNLGAGDGSIPVLPSAVTRGNALVPPDKPTRFPVFGVICGTCGYLRLHGMHILAEWVKGKTR